MSAERSKLDLAALASLTFRAPDESRFPALRLVRDAERAGGTRTAVLSAADEIAVSRFLDGDIRYTDIVKLVADTVERAPEIPCDSIEAVLEADRIARELAGAWQARR
jgi:1-deoxy-D-xylulose-5-phosphate reductoisomerase